ncbi:phosphoglycerate dehydrogenase [Gleimia hominis]|uniref:D-3-phosphoglycerate dehydrogenase n=1 Tax=Gleimia hominis TaxID=595468 RepID=A0ABU3IAZ9_9ACTO|nr:phosphoglycerate dehydrogenase [Gleimia hominis]MDT3767547.1 phosphoglycerate dehydrogenase [Gleimia hominis]
MSIRALLVENPHSKADNIFEDNGIEVVRHTGAMDESELKEALHGFQILGLRSKTTVSKQVLDANPQLLAIGAFCIGTNQIDLAAASNAGVAVFNAPYSNTRSVVELAIAEIIALNRRLTVKNSNLHRGLWAKSAAGSHEVRGKTLGIVGYGNIGTQLSVLAESLGMEVIFYDIAERLALGNARPVGSLAQLLQESDFVSIHVSGRPQNTSMFTAAEFQQMKPGAMFINLSRGFVTDIDALVDALESGRLAGAAVDVFPQEPKKNGDPFESPLAGMDNVILTPHVGGSTEEAQFDIGQFVAHKVSDYIQTASTDMSVNLPNLTLLPASASRYRVGLIHRNTPGVLALINQTFAEHGANIDGQILGTSGGIGYALTDISSELPAEAITAIDSLQENIRLRILARP